MQPPFVFTNGMMAAATSDSPCTPLEPLLGLHAVVTRQTRSGGLPVAPEEAIDPLDGLHMYTINAAYAMSRENETGSLEAGKRADMVVLSHDPTVVDPAFIRDITVEQTYVEGQCLYQR